MVHSLSARTPSAWKTSFDIEDPVISHVLCHFWVQFGCLFKIQRAGLRKRIRKRIRKRWSQRQRQQPWCRKWLRLGNALLHARKRSQWHLGSTTTKEVASSQRNSNLTSIERNCWILLGIVIRTDIGTYWTNIWTVCKRLTRPPPSPLICLTTQEWQRWGMCKTFCTLFFSYFVTFSRALVSS